MHIRRTLLTIAVAIAVAVAAGPAFAQKGGGKGARAGAAAGKGAKGYPNIAKAIKRTHVVIVVAANAVKKGGEGKADLRKAIVHNRAARAELRRDHPAVAAMLTLRGRAAARDAIKANKQTVKKADEADAPDETKAAEGADQAQADAAVAEAEKEVPPAEEVAAKADSLDAEGAVAAPPAAAK